MADHHHTPAPVDPQAIQASQCVWHGFTKAAVITVVGVAALLSFLAILLLR